MLVDFPKKFDFQESVKGHIKHLEEVLFEGNKVPTELKEYEGRKELFELRCFCIGRDILEAKYHDEKCLKDFIDSFFLNLQNLNYVNPTLVIMSNKVSQFID